MGSLRACHTCLPKAQHSSGKFVHIPVLPQERISDICEKPIIVLIIYCNFNDIFIINTIILPYSTLSPKALLITYSYLVSHMVFGPEVRGGG